MLTCSVWDIINSEHYNIRMVEALTGLSGFHWIIDDIIIYDSGVTDHVHHVKTFLQRCTDRQITLNVAKCHFFQQEVTFTGFKLCGNGYQVDQSITDAISNFPTPINCTDLWSFFGLVNQLPASTNTISSLLTPLRPLLSTKNHFQWSETHNEVFQTAKQHLTVTPILSFNINKPTRLCTDASRHDLGFILQQQNQDVT